MDINSLPPISGSQMKAMEQGAARMAAEQGFVVPHPEIQRSAQVQVSAPVVEQKDQMAWQLQGFVEPEQVQEQPEQVTQAVEEVIESEPTPQPKARDPQESFRELRLKAEKAERERDELLRKYYDRELASQPKAQQAVVDEEDLDFKLADDDLADGKIANKLDKKVKKLEQQLREQQQQAQLANTQARIQSQFTDFDKVVTQDNLDIFEYTYPELAKTLNSSQDLYAKAVSAYTMIKNLGIYKEQTISAEKKRIEENSMKPRLAPAMASAQQGDSPLAQANRFAMGLTPELQKELAREMNSSRKHY